jgi:ABC-2 type transport system ATP-binding protein
MTRPDLAIEAAGLTKYFGNEKAVDSLDLAVPRGSVYAFLGSNGAGKSTTILMLLGFLRPTSGQSWVLGHDSRKLTPSLRGRIGYMAETHPLHDWMRVDTEVAFTAGFHPSWNWDLYRSIAGLFDLSPRARVNTLSRGQRAGLSLALTLAPEPELLILDDPTLGLDPVARESVLDVIAALTTRTGHTVLISTHDVGDIPRVADHAALLSRSSLVMAGPIEALTAGMRRFRLTFAPGTMPLALPAIPGLLTAKRSEGALELTFSEAGSHAGAAVAAMGAIVVEESAVAFSDAVVARLAAADHPLSLHREATAAVAGGA